MLLSLVFTTALHAQGTSSASAESCSKIDLQMLVHTRGWVCGRVWAVELSQAELLFSRKLSSNSEQLLHVFSSFHKLTVEEEHFLCKLKSYRPEGSG